MQNKALMLVSRGLALAVVGVFVSLSSSTGYGAVVDYMSTITPDSSTSPGDYPGVANVFYMPYTASNSSVTVNSSEVSLNLGSFFTNSWGTGATPNPNVVSSGFTLQVNPTISSTNYGPLTFYGEITNPSANVYCLDFDTSSSFSHVSSSYNCQTHAATPVWVTENYDGNLYNLQVQTYLWIASPTKSTILTAQTGVPEPMSLGTTAFAIFALMGLVLRRKLRAVRS